MQLLYSNSGKSGPYSLAKEHYFNDISSDFMNNDLVNRKMVDSVKRNGHMINDMDNDFLSLNNEMAQCLKKVKKYNGKV